MSNNPADWSTVPAENNNLPLLTKKVNGQTVQLSRDESNQIYADWKTASEVVVVRDIGTFREFMELFTDAEQLAIIDLTRTNTAIKHWYDQALAGNVWLGHPKVSGGLDALVALGTIDAARKAEIVGSNFDA